MAEIELGLDTFGDVTADDNGQMTAYAYLLASNKFVFPTAPVQCRFDLRRKLKTPKLEHVHTARAAEQRKRFSKVAKMVLAGIDAGVYTPSRPGCVVIVRTQTPVERGSKEVKDDAYRNAESLSYAL